MATAGGKPLVVAIVVSGPGGCRGGGLPLQP